MRIRPLIVIHAPLAIAAAALAATTTPATQPAATHLHGTLTLPPNTTVTRIAAIDRTLADVLKTSQEPPKPDKFLYPGTFDPKTSTFDIPNLLPTRTYDIVIWTKDPAGNTARWEGANMDYHRDITPSTPATDEDRKWIETFISDTPTFYDKSRVIRIAADHGHATALVELQRTRDFHSDKGGEIIYRVELWYFENLFGGWAKDKNTEVVLARWRGPGQTLPTIWQFEPTLGNLTPNDNPLTLQLPDTPTPKHGLAK